MSKSNAHQTVCLGCGCACDDIEIVEISENETPTIRNACELGEVWLAGTRDGARCEVEGKEVALAEAISAAAERLSERLGAVLVYVGDDLSIAAHGDAIGLADRWGATIDGPAADTVAEGMLATARRGRSSGTLGELRHGVDLVLWWGIDPDERYPRFVERFIAAGRFDGADRRQVAVDVGVERGPEAVPDRIGIPPEEELETIGQLRGILRGSWRGEPLAGAQRLAECCRDGGRIGIVYDAEPRAEVPTGRAEALQLLAQQLYGEKRTATWGLRAGGNRNGWESVMTWQTGFPFGVDFGAGWPRFVGEESVAGRLDRERYETVLMLGRWDAVPPEVQEGFGGTRVVVIGPRATEAPWRIEVAIETGRVGIHEEGLVARMDDVPLMARPWRDHPHRMREILARLDEAIVGRRGEET